MSRPTPRNMLQSMANWLAQLKPTHHPLYRKGVEEVIAAAFNGYQADKGQPVLLSEWQEQQIRLADIHAELERVTQENDRLRALILALPKVQGEIVVVCLNGQWWVKAVDPKGPFYISPTEQQARSLQAVWMHRQGMEG